MRQQDDSIPELAGADRCRCRDEAGHGREPLRHGEAARRIRDGDQNLVAVGALVGVNGLAARGAVVQKDHRLLAAVHQHPLPQLPPQRAGADDDDAAQSAVIRFTSPAHGTK